MAYGDETARTRTTAWDDPHRLAAAGRSMAGIDYVLAMLRGELPHPPISQTLGFFLAEVEEGRVVFTCTPAEYHFNPIATVHGGIAATLIDSSTGCAVHTTIPLGGAYTTMNIAVDLLRPITDRTGPIRCEGRVIHRGSRLAIATADVVSERDGKVLARGQTSCMILSG